MKNTDAKDEDEPVVLKEYRRQQKEARRSARKLKDLGTIDNDKGVDVDGSLCKVDNNFIDNQITVADTTDTTSLDLDDMEDNSSDGNDFVEFFINTFPGISKSFEDVETQFHTFATRFKRKIKPPQQCYTCRDGADGASTCTAHISHVYPQPQVDVENYTNRARDDNATEDMDKINSHSSMQDVDIHSYCCNITGKYKLVHNHNFDVFLKAMGVPVLLRKAANASKPVHTITHDGRKLRIQVDGITKGDTTFIIGGPPAQSNIRHLKFDDHVTYVDDGDAVEVRKVALNAPANGAVCLLIKRQLANNGHNLVVTSKARFKDGSESLESVQTYHRIG